MKAKMKTQQSVESMQSNQIDKKWLKPREGGIDGAGPAPDKPLILHQQQMSN